jgi:hypothetical protein
MMDVCIVNQYLAHQIFIHGTKLHFTGSISSTTQFGQGLSKRRCHRQTKHDKHGMRHIVALPFTLRKQILKGKDELSKVNYVTMQKSTLQKILGKKPKSFQPL